MATAVGHRIGRDEIIWAFGPDLEPVLEVEPGETVTFETNDCFTGQITSEDDALLSGGRVHEGQLVMVGIDHRQGTSGRDGDEGGAR